jgi:predicted AlkP superfamily pyrophosphatase or phosphodiesterase
LYPENHGIIANSFTNPFTGDKYRIGKSQAVKDSKWYIGEAFWETAERNNIKTASYFWPGSEVELNYRHPSIFETYEHNKPYKDRIDGVINWLQRPPIERPHFLTLYFHDTDTYGHNYGPNSTEINQSIQRLDSLIGYLNVGITEIGMTDSINIIVVSDHGMTDISSDKYVNIEEMLKGYEFELGGAKTFMMIEPSHSDFDSIYNKLKLNENHYKVYLKDEVPDYFHFSRHPFISSIVLVAEMGWSLVNNEWLKVLNSEYTKGNHGFDNNHVDMHGIFIARGPNFKVNYTTGTLWNIDINPLLCKIFNIQPRSNIDGDLERIQFILK